VKRLTFVSLLFLGALFLGRLEAFGTIADGITPKVISGQCASGGTVYDNRTSSLTAFDLSIENSGGMSCPVTLSWTDANGNSQSFTLLSGSSLTVATSLGAYGKILWSSQGTANVNFSWFLSQVVNVGSLSGSVACNTSGTIYENLTQGAIYLHLAFLATGCPVAFSWIDASGIPQAVNLAGAVNGNGLPEFQNSEGVSTSLPPGGVISWTSRTGQNSSGGGWQLERIVEPGQ
jgi:hypothetical protein